MPICDLGAAMRAADAIPDATLTADAAPSSSAPAGAQALQRARSAQIEETEEETRRRVEWIKYSVGIGISVNIYCLNVAINTSICGC